MRLIFEPSSVRLYISPFWSSTKPMTGLVIVQAASEDEADQGSPASESDPLARTGLDPIPLGIAALVLAIVGLVALRFGRTSIGEGR